MKEREDQTQIVNNPQELQRYIIRGSLDLSQIEELDRDVPLRVAAVRDNRVIQSGIIDLRGRQDPEIDFDLEFHLPSPRCGVHLVVSRGDIGEEEILGLEGFKRWISAAQWKEGKAGSNPFTIDVGSITIPDRIYKLWFTICRRYTIRGRVVCRRWHYDPIEQQWVFVDAPVPGATVEAYDVDCWWWWCFRDLIQTAVTDINGYFEMNFVWCCRTWFPFRVPWVIEPGLLDRIRELLAQAKPPIGPLPPDPPVDPLAFQEYLFDIAGRANAPAAANIAAQTLALPESAAPPPTSAQALKALLPPAPDLEALHVWPWWPWRDCRPDVIFRVTQPCEGEVKVIYEEGITQTRWNIPQMLNVTLEANHEACCLPTQDDPPCGDCLVITTVGCLPGGVPVGEIGTSIGPPDLRGYAYPNTLDRPFGGSLNFWGDFGEDSHPILDFYRIEYHKEGMPAGTWIDAGSVPGLLGKITRKYHDPDTFPPPYTSPAIDFGADDFVGDGKFYYKTRYKYQRDNATSEPSFGWIWTNPNLLLIVNSDKLPGGDGLYTFRVIGYRQAADGSLVDERVMPLCGTEDDPSPTPVTIMLRIDNRNAPHPLSTPAHPCGPETVHTCTAEPDCDFVSVIKNEGGAGMATINACDFETIADTDTLTIHFNVTVPDTVTDAHLLAYQMTAHYGESGVFNVLTAGTLAGDPTPEFGPTYAQALAQGATRPFWSGGSFKLTLPGSAFPQSCAYLLRLRAWKRTFNGCTRPYHFHWNVCEFSFCVIKPE
jgi:hypothetical protein